MEMIKIKLNKKAQFNPVSIAVLLIQLIFSNWIFFTVAVLGLGLMVGWFFFNLGTVLGICLILIAVYAKIAGADWKTTLFIAGLGFFALINPFDIAKLEMMRG